MPFTHYIGDRHVLLWYTTELPVSEQQSVSVHRMRMDDPDGVADAEKALSMLSVGEIPEPVFRNAEPYNMRNAVERAYSP